MTRRAFAARETVRFLLTLMVIMGFVFLLPRLSGRDPLAELINDPSMDPAVKQYYVERWGLQLPLYQQYANFLVGIFTGDLGYSVTFRQPVAQVISNTLPYTVLMLVVAIGLSLVLGVKAGLKAGGTLHGRFDKSLYVICRIILAAPTFWIAMLVVLTLGGYLSVIYQVAPLLSILPPALTLALFGFARNALYARSMVSSPLSLLSSLRSPSILRTLAGDFATLTSGSVLVETAYRFPGMGRLMFEAITRADYQLIQGVFFVLASTVLVVASVVRFVESERKRRGFAEVREGS